MNLGDIWGYPYRLGIGIFLTIGTLVIVLAFLGITLWLERSFQKDKLKK